MIFLGAPYPIRPNPRGLLAVQNGIAQVRSDMLQLLLTNPGERVMLPQYGTPLRDLVFDPNDDTLVEKAKAMIINSIKTWEPRITVQDIQVFTGVDKSNLPLNRTDDGSENEHILGIVIQFFDPEQISVIQTLQLEIPLATGA